MDLYSFQYPPRPTSSQGYRPTRYYFHNLDQDALLAKKSALSTAFQKEGIPSTIVSNKTSQGADTAVVARMKSASRLGEKVQSEQEIAVRMENDGERMSVTGLVVLDRSKFLVD
ncbi:hypothetical protein FBU30_006354 [Linnemannia zychae]|nr:hypothetical protein FBU30_006354 [Linnemannia zychae]